MNTKSIAIGLSIAVAATILNAQSAPAPQKVQPKLAAIINGEPLTVQELDGLYNRLPPQMKAEYEKSGGKTQFLDTYIRKRLLVQEALKQNFDKQPATQFELQAARESVLFDLYVRDVISKAFVNDSEMKALYENSKFEFAVPEQIRARHILIAPRPLNAGNQQSVEEARQAALLQANEIYQRIHRGQATFEQMAQQFSMDGSAQGGGDLGFFPRGKMVKEFEDAAFALKEGEMSPVVPTQFGFHIIKMEEHRPTGFRPFDDVKEQLRERLLRKYAEQVMQSLNALTQDLRQASRIAIYPENL